MITDALAQNEEAVMRYYDGQTDKFYLAHWDHDDFHFGIFGDDEIIDPYYGGTTAYENRRRGILRTTQQVIEPAQIKESDVVLDAGCGVGGTSHYIAKTFGAKVLGVTISQQQVQIAREKCQNLGLSERVSFEQANCCESLPLEDQSVDVIVNIESACHYSDRPTFLRECARVLKRGGRMVAEDWVARDGISLADYSQFIEPLCRSWYLPSLETASSYNTLLTRHGFQVASLEEVDKGLAPNMTWMRSSMRVLEAMKARNLVGNADKEDMDKWIRQFQSVTDAWKAGHFTLLLYYAIR